MKKFEAPQVEIEKIELQDVIATSNDCPTNTQLPCFND